MATELKVTVKPSGQGGDYTTLASALVGAGQNLVTADKYLLVEIGGDWTGVADTTQANIPSNFTTDATRYVKIYTTGDARHDGTYGGNPKAYRLEVTNANTYTLSIGDECSWVDGLQIKTIDTSNLTYGGIYCDYTGTVSGFWNRISNNIIWGVLSSASTSDMYGIVFDAGSNTDSVTVYGWNNICYGWKYSSVTSLSGIKVYTSGCHSYWYNNTCTANYAGIQDSAAASETMLKNNLCVNNSVDFSSSAGVHSSSTGNLSSDTSAPAFGSYYRSKTVTFKGGSNFLLRNDDAQARGRGINLYNDATLAITDDICGTARDGWVWDIGAHQSSVVYVPDGMNNGLTADEFSDQSLGSQWTWDAGVSGSYVENSSGNLVITAGTGGPSPYPETITKMYQTATGDFDVWTKMSWDAFTENMQECGLEIGAPSFTSPYGSSCSLFAAMISGTKYLWYCHVVNGGEYDSADIFEFTGTTIWLRIKRQGDQFTAYYATAEPTTGGWTKLANPSTTWNTAGDVPVTLMAIRNGGSTSFTATFEYFRLSSGTAFINDEFDDSSTGSFWAWAAGTGGTHSEDTADHSIVRGTGDLLTDNTMLYQYGVTGDFDVWTKLVTSANLGSNYQFAGIYVRDCGAMHSTFAGIRYADGFYRSRVDGFTYDGGSNYQSNEAGASGTATTTFWIRVKRSGSQFYLWLTDAQPYQESDWGKSISRFSAFGEMVQSYQAFQSPHPVLIGLCATGGNSFTAKYAFIKNWLSDAEVQPIADEFNDQISGPQWGWRAGTSGTHTENASGGHEIYSGTGAFWPGQTYDPTGIYQRVSGDFDVWTKVTVPTLTGNYQHAGLSFCLSDSSAADMVSIRRYYYGLQCIDYMHGVSGSAFEADQIATTATTVWLRLRRAENTITAYYATSDPTGGGWTQCSQPSTTLSSYADGYIWVECNAQGGSQFTATFDYFHTTGETYTKTIKPSGQGGDYTTLAAAFSAYNGTDCVAEGYNLVFQIGGDWTGVSESLTSQLAISLTTDKFNALTIQATGDARVSKAQYQSTGKPYRLAIAANVSSDGWIFLSSDFTTVDGLQIQYTSSSNTNWAGIYFYQNTLNTHPGRAVLSNCILKGVFSGTAGSGIQACFLGSGVSPSYVQNLIAINCIFQDWIRGTSEISCFKDLTRLWMFNCLFHNCWAGYYSTYAVDFYRINCIGYNNTMTWRHESSVGAGEFGSHNVVNDNDTTNWYAMNCNGPWVTCGVNTSVTSGHLIDANNWFEGVEVGMWVICTENWVTAKPTYVTAVSPGDLTLNDHVFTSSGWIYYIVRGWYKSPTFADAANDDFTLDAADTAALDKGTNLSRAYPLAFLTDILGTER